ncbi:LuxR C-terminal-related transcriptional regulator [Gracilibacillus kekensis]|uniref:LuxR family transcriptional regulator, maltose regulon positive regulatory protein n=1 Tax=Gracilibacillus kekensis TaxID=1027249 RepID=A0A1M7QRI6_9BACI|nr:LuxR C-terminal-related transcriptional regulator [Gracilibacillus kekensis]SHN33953.1 LuxR family transcriptional regulator, maltose regulon positive regulatory protein [Gracilibacillus kekensis]
MSLPILSTKLHIPLAKSEMVPRTHLFRYLNESLDKKLTLVSAPAGYGKTTLVGEWIAQSEYKAAWISLDEYDNDPFRFLQYLMFSIRKFIQLNKKDIDTSLSYHQSMPIEYILTTLINDISACEEPFIFVLDDYHFIESKAVHDAVSFLINNQPSQMHLIILTRKDPPLPIAGLRAKDDVTEVRGNDLRFTVNEATFLFNHIMKFSLSRDEVDFLESLTEGWVVGLHLAAISMQGRSNKTQFISSFTGNHRYVLDYLMEEVLMQQPPEVQTFLLQTSILERFCSPLCDAVLQKGREGGNILALLERYNLFVIPLDNERRWYRYHHLFSDLLRQRLHHTYKEIDEEVYVLHNRASQWFEKNGYEIEAFKHATAAQNVERVTKLILGKEIPLHFRGGVREVLKWLKHQKQSTLDKQPSLWVTYASALLIVGQSNGVEQKLSAAEAALNSKDLDEPEGDIIGHIASIRATLAVTRNKPDTIIHQSLIALKHLHPHNLHVRSATTWSLGVAYQLKGKRRYAKHAYLEALSLSKKIDHKIITLMATLGIGQIEELDNQLNLAMQTYKQVVQIAGEPPLPAACDAHFGMARIYYQWNKIEESTVHSDQSIVLAREVENTDRLSECELFAVKLKLAKQELSEAEDLLMNVRHKVQERSYDHLLSEVTHLEFVLALYCGSFTNEMKLLQTEQFPVLEARSHIAKGNAKAALTLLDFLHEQAIENQWQDEILKLLILQALALQVEGNMEEALQKLKEVITLAERENFLRLFVDEGKSLYVLLTEAYARRIHPDYTKRLLSAMRKEQKLLDYSSLQNLSLKTDYFVDTLSNRELEVLYLIAEGLSNQEIGDRLFLALSTVKGYNRNIFEKLQVKRRTEAIARAREIGLI